MQPFVWDTKCIMFLNETLRPIDFKNMDLEDKLVFCFYTHLEIEFCSRISDYPDSFKHKIDRILINKCIQLKRLRMFK